MSSAQSERLEEQFTQAIRGHIRSRSLIDPAELVAEVIGSANEKPTDSEVSAFKPETPFIFVTNDSK